MGYRISMVAGVCIALGLGDAASAAEIENMIAIPGGKVELGLSPERIDAIAAQYGINPDMLALHRSRTVRLEPFLIDRHETTVGEYRAFLQATGHPAPAYWVNGFEPTADRDVEPVTGVDFEDALAYAQWAGKRLPSDDEWERAARGDDGRPWVWGNAWNPAAFDRSDGVPPARDRPAPVGARPLDLSPYGVMDMAGNVLEWVASERPEGVEYTAMTRGGAFVNEAPYMFLATARNAQPRGNGIVRYIGFRCARDLPEGMPTAEAAPPSAPLAAAPVPAVAATGGDEPDLDPRAPIRIYPIRERRHTQVGLSALDLDTTGLEPTPWRVELRAPSLPDDRFTILFENHNMAHRPMDRMVFGEDRSRAELASTIPGDMDIRIALEGHPDYVDIAYDLTNLADRPQLGHEMCLLNLWAPTFADHDGTRTFVSTDRGLRRMNEVNHEVWERFWLQDYWHDRPPRPGVGPRVEGDSIMVESRDGRWVIAPVVLSHPVARLFNNREHPCVHCNPESMLQPGERRAIVQRVYLMRGNREDVARRYEADRTMAR